LARNLEFEMLARVLRIVLAAAFACLTAGVVHDLFVAGNQGRGLSLTNIVETALTSAWWAAPFAVIGIMLTELLRLRSGLVYLLGGLVIALAAALMHRDGGVPSIAALARLPSFSMLLTMGTLGGLVYWLLQGYRAGWRGDAAEAGLASAKQSILQTFERERKPRCWPCLLTGLLLAAFPLLALGYWSLEEPGFAENVKVKTEMEANTALAEAGHPWSSVRIDGYRGYVEGSAATEAQREAAFAAAQTYLQPAIGMPGVIGVLENGIKVPAVVAPAVAVATPTPPPQPRIDETARRAAEAEARRLAELAEAKRKADAEAETRRLAELAEAKRKADAEAETRRLAELAEAKRKADAEAETRRLADLAEAKRKADADAAALAKGKADEERRITMEAEAKRAAAIVAAEADAKRKADEARTTVVTKTPPPAVVAPAPPAVLPTLPSLPPVPPRAPVLASPADGACDAEAVVGVESTRLTFDTASSDIGAPDKTEILRLSSLLKRCPAMKVTINGHTDDVGAEGYNASLSQRRAEIIRSELVGQGIANDRFVVRWFGGTRPLASNASEAGRAVNRRVELTLNGGLDLAAPANTARVTACRSDFSRLLTQGGIVFEPSSAVIAAVSFARLDDLATAAKACAAFGLLVEGHADKTGNPSWNVQLSGLRAKAVREALVARGVPATRVDAKGFGSSRLLDPADTKDAHAKNRRIEISIGAPVAQSN
jgi:outer membrane protein OmpA-like peptidoglycan-associated protein